MRAEFLPFHRPCIGQEEALQVLKILESGWLTTGPSTKAFEKQFAEYCSAAYAVAVNSGTAAMHLALVLSGVGTGDQVITSPITFPATANVIVHQGAKPVFVDVEADTLNMDATKIKEVVTPRTKAIMPVHFAGHPCDMDRIMDVSRRHNLTVIEDGAHALGAEYRGMKIGSIGDFTAFSFYATKNITTGEGGMLTCNNAESAEKATVLSLHGISKDAWKRYGKEGYSHWETIYPGYKYNMFDIQAALGMQQLRKADYFWEKRVEYSQIYDEAFSMIPEIVPLARRDEVKSAFHLYVVLLKVEELSADRDMIMNAIQAEKIGIGIHFRALHLQKYYRETFGFERGDFPRAEYASDRLISLPLYPAMTPDDVKDVIAVVKKVIRRYRKATW